MLKQEVGLVADAGQLLIVTRQLDELGVRAARLRAERDGAETVTLSAELARRAADPEIELIFAGERTLFESRRTARLGQKAQLSERKAQLGQEIAGLERQLKAKLRELNLIATELQGLESLFQRNLVSMTKYTATQREAARLGGEEGQIVAGIAQAKGRIGEIDLQIIQIDQDLRTEVIKELRDMEAKQAELNERRIAAEDSRKRIDIRAPMSGIVHQLTVHTVGGVVNAGEPLMLIVPQSDALVIEAKVSPQDIDQLHVSQATKVRLVAFNQRTTPELDGAVAHVSADLTTNTDTGQTYYIARITIPDHELQRIAPLRLRPGMPAEIHIGTGSRTALSYLMKPLQDQFARTFKER